MNYAIQQYKNDPTGIPDGWPQLIRILKDDREELKEGEKLYTQEELDNLRKSLQSAMDARDSADVSAKQTAQRDIEQLKLDARKELVLALANWDTLTAGQLKAVQKRLAQAVICFLL